MARRYRHGRPTIGVLAGWQFAWTATPLSYLEPVYRGISRAADDLGCNLLLGCGMGSWTIKSNLLRPAWPIPSPEADFLPIGPWNTDGLIAVNPLHSQVLSRYLQGLRAEGFPLIFVASGEEGPTIAVDNRSGILQAMQHLVAHGHRRIAFIAGSPEDQDGDSGERLRAYHDAVHKHDLVVDPRLVAWGLHVYDGGYGAMQTLLGSGMDFTAVLASNDESALGAIKAMREAGYRVPQDMTIVGFDDRPESAVQRPALSSVHVPLRRMGYRAVWSLSRYITGEAQTIEPAMVETRLVARESCGCGTIAPRFAVPLEAGSPTDVQDPKPDHGQLVRAMVTAVLTESRGLSTEETKRMVERLVSDFEASVANDDPSRFRETLDAILHQVTAGGDDAHVWQTALSMLGHDLGGGARERRGVAHELMEQAILMISSRVQRRFRENEVDHRWTLNRLGLLTAHLLAALDEAQVYEVLAQHLPSMGIDTAWLALFHAEGDDPVGATTLRDITSVAQNHGWHELRFASREFPPSGLLPAGEAFCLALFPLSGMRGQLGYVAFDTAQLDLYGALTQELATALNSAELHRETTEARRMAEEANALKSRFLSTVSHELRTPLSLIVGLSGILLQEGAEGGSTLPEAYVKDVEQIHTNAQHLGGLIGDVLDLARDDAGQMRLVKEFVDLGEALRLVAETGRQLAYEKGLSWHADLSEGGAWVWGDRTRLRQVVLNLVNNAVKFTAQGQVRLAVTTGPDVVTVTVSDTGLGIPPEEQSTVFDEFRRSERSVGRGYSGLGLGLSICKRLVELHGGTIGVRSSGEEGAGSTFSFTLPKVQPTVRQVEYAGVPSSSEQTVLVLSHSKGSGRRLKGYLAERGFEVCVKWIDETPDWLSQLSVSPPGAVVVDVSAAPQQGWGVLQAIKGQPGLQSLPVLFCSLSAQGGSVVEFNYLTKPIELADLSRALDQHWAADDTDPVNSAVLIVDDDPGTLEMNARIVRDHMPSHRVLTVSDGVAALAALQHEQIDLVLLDLMMPELDGFGVLEAMRETEAMRRIPVIVLTGQVLTEEDMARLNRGVQTVLSKGLFSPEETLDHLDKALENKRRLSGEAQRLVRQAMAYIHTHYHEPISRTDLARHVALSEDYLTSCFRTELGVTPIAYLNRYRVNQARQLLAETGKSITEISLDVGFSDSGYFSRVFRREVGLSPDAYRKA